MDENKQNGSSGYLRCILVIVGILLMAGAGYYAWWMVENKPTAKRRPPPSLTPKVQVEDLKSRDVQVDIAAMGVVIPSKEATLRARVSGEVLKMHQHLEPGGIVNQDDPIIWIDDADYKLNVQMKNAVLKKAESALQLELVQQRIAEIQFKSYSKSDKNEKLDMDMILRKPQERSMRADIMAAEADIKRAELDLSRTIVKAPFNAVVLERAVDIGEQADQQRILVTVAGIDSYWVQVSIPVKSLKWILFPSQDQKGSQVEITCRRGKRKGQVLRLMSSLESKGRMAQILVEVKDPLDLETGNDKRIPLLLGEYVRVAIQGKMIKNVVEIPRKAFHDNKCVWLMTPEKRLAIIEVNPVWDVRDAIFVPSKDLPQGKLILSNLGFPVQGMTLTAEKSMRSIEQRKTEITKQP